MELKNTFLALSNILLAVEGRSVFEHLDMESQAILKFVAANEAQLHELCVTDVTGNPMLPGAPATKLKRIHALQEQGWLLFEKSAQHHRRVRIILAPKATNEMASMTQQLNKQLRSLLG